MSRCKLQTHLCILQCFGLSATRNAPLQGYVMSGCNHAVTVLSTTAEQPSRGLVGASQAPITSAASLFWVQPMISTFIPPDANATTVTDLGSTARPIPGLGAQKMKPRLGLAGFAFAAESTPRVRT